MAKKKLKPSEPRPNDHWVISTEIQINGRNVVPGVELKVSKERGRFSFIRQVVNGDITWIEVWGGPAGHECIRSFYPERIVRVHYKNKTVDNLAKEYKAKQKAKKAAEEDNVV
jgi:hypothetical protein